MVICERIKEKVISKTTLTYEKRIKAIIKSTDKSNLPIVIELAGMPRVGKTEFTDALIDLFRRSKHKAVASVQGDFNCPIIDRWSIDFSVWTITTFIKQFYEFKHSGQEVIVADRGLFDAIVWLRLKMNRGICDQGTFNSLRQFVMSGPWWDNQGVVLVFFAPVTDVLRRAEERRLYRGDSLVTTEKILPHLKKALETERRLCNEEKHFVEEINSQNKSLKDVLHEATDKMLSILEDQPLS